MFNNAAVSIVLSDTGNECFALELFLGALESKLSYECTQLPVDSLETEQDERESSLHHLGVRPSRPGCVLRAETLFQNLETCLQPRPTCAEEVQQDNGGIDSAITVPQHCRGYDPYIYKTPMSIPDHLVSTHFTSSAIVYNLALIHQMFNRESQAAAQFYEISATLLIGSGTDDQTPESSLLRMALLNNFGVWCFENSDGEVMRTCMEEMAIAMDDPSQKRIQLEENVRQGFRENIRWLLTPLNGGSPAA